MEKPSEAVFTACAVVVLVVALGAVLRLAWLLPASNRATGEATDALESTTRVKDAGAPKPPPDASLMVLLGSGGHTGEMLRVLEQWSHLEDYNVHFVVSSGDNTSLLKLKELGLAKYSVSTIHRARDVGHGLFPALINTLRSFASCAGVVWRLKPDVFLSNGPGTAIPISYTLFVLKFFGLARSQIVFVESLARVDRLSLTGHLILPITDRFLVQWPLLAKRYPRCEYRGILV